LHGVAVVTQQTPATDFSKFSTFSVDPTVAVVDQTGSVTNNFTVDGTPLAKTITDNMTSRGYTLVPWVGNATPADLPIKMEAHLGSADVYYPGYCGWYPYYYCYPGWTYAGSYSFGTLVLAMGDNTVRAPQGSKLPLVWTSASYGILSSYYSSGGPANGTNVNFPKIQESINRAFDDSPYIHK
jgi:hypothetical protein